MMPPPCYWWNCWTGQVPGQTPVLPHFYFLLHWVQPTDNYPLNLIIQPCFFDPSGCPPMPTICPNLDTRILGEDIVRRPVKGKANEIHWSPLTYKLSDFSVFLRKAMSLVWHDLPLVSPCWLFPVTTFSSCAQEFFPRGFAPSFSKEPTKAG